ncbi:MAG: error-prone DNA polymerase [Alphaproteobacteria bacterium]|nr:error-prone DNA polymerase [Alphaproteobacteria bacterium]
MSYVELVSRSCFSLLHGASHPEELVESAHALGLAGLAIADRDAVYGLPQAHGLAAGLGLPLLCGATVTVDDAAPVVLLAETRAGWGRLCRLLTDARHAAAKGRAVVPVARVAQAAPGLTCLLLDGWTPAAADPLRQAFGAHLEVVLSRQQAPTDGPRTRRALALARALGCEVVASNDVVMHDPVRRRLADVLTAIRRRTTLDRLGRAAHANAERHLLAPDAFAQRFGDLPAAVARTVAVAERCAFRLSELSYTYPREVVPDGWTPMGWLRHLVAHGVVDRYPQGAPAAVRAQLDHELAVIEALDFPSYFLTVHDIVRFARGRGILCQGRGSAANSAVCFVLGVTSVDPSRASLLFERFISEERGEPPDIDVDFEHERREEVIQYLYARYGRQRAAMVNEVIAYRGRSAVRDVGKAFGMSLDQVDRMAGLLSRWSAGGLPAVRDEVADVGLDPDSPTVRWTLQVAEELVGFPRHLGIHSGGFVIAEGDVVELVPVEPATMADRTVVQWDKYGVEGLGFVKVDVLALGMLTAIRKAFELIEGAYGARWALHTVPSEDPAVYEMFSRADTVGVFQIESRAQQSMLPRLRPQCFYDLVIEVAIVRPGPIQGGMVHPYLRRRNGDEPIVYAHPALEPILERTLGVPLFQEQVMAMAVAVGGFTPGEADQLRRAMGAWRKRGTLDGLGDRLVTGMRAKGIAPDFCAAIVAQIKGFGEYGFPESHAASFALLVYVSGWLKCHHPEAFCAGLINSQPMGFYSPRTLVADAQRHDVVVHEVCVNASGWDCSLEPQGGGADASGPTATRAHLRLGLRLVRGLKEEVGRAIEAERARGPFASLPDFQRRCGLDQGSLRKLADADAFRDLVPDRREAVWTLQGLWEGPLFAGVPRQEPPPPLPRETSLEALEADYRAVGLSLGNHPAIEARKVLADRGVHPIRLATLPTLQAGRRVRILGLVSSRQRPGTAKGVVFLSLEDETGMANVIVWPQRWEAQRKVIAGHPVLVIDGLLQLQDGAFSVLLERAWSVAEVGAVHAPSRDFR